MPSCPWDSWGDHSHRPGLRGFRCCSSRLNNHPALASACSLRSAIARLPVSRLLERSFVSAGRGLSCRYERGASGRGAHPVPGAAGAPQQRTDRVRDAERTLAALDLFKCVGTGVRSVGENGTELESEYLSTELDSRSAARRADLSCDLG
jgi:hypothetical protein